MSIRQHNNTEQCAPLRHRTRTLEQILLPASDVPRGSPSEQPESEELLVALSFMCFIAIIPAYCLNFVIPEVLLTLSGSSILMLVLLRYLIKPVGRRLFCPLDTAIVFVWTTELITFAVSAYRRNSYNAILALSALVVAYGLLRILLLCWPEIRYGIPVVAVLGAGFATVQAVYTSAWYMRAARVGLTELTSLRARSPGVLIPLINDRATVLLLCIAFSLFSIDVAPTRRRLTIALRGLSVACNVALISGLLLTVSRGAYLGLGALFIGVTVVPLVVHVDAKVLLVNCYISFFVALIVVAISLPPMRGAFKKLILIDQSVSQLRSTSGHLAIWKASADIARDHSILGVGQDNLPVYLVPQVSKKDDVAFAGQALCTPLQILAERGIIGIIAFSFLIVGFLWSAFRLALSSHSPTIRREGIICIAALLALVVRELTYSSVLLNPYVSMLTWLVMGITATRTVGHERLFTTGRRKRFGRVALRTLAVVAILLFASSAVIAFRGVRFVRAADLSDQAVMLWNEGRVDEGLSAMTTALHSDPENAYLLSLEGLEQGRLGLPRARLNAACGIEIDDQGADKNLLQEAILHYENAARLVPLDDNFANNLGWLYIYAGDKSLGERYLRRAMELDRQEAAYHVGLGMLLASQRRYESANSEFAIALSLRPEMIASPLFRCLAQRRPADANSIVCESATMLGVEAGRTANPLQEGRLGALLLYRGQASQAIPVLRDGVERLPGLPLAWIHLGMALRDTGRNHEAEIAFQKAGFLEAFRGDGVNAARMSEGLWTDRPITDHAERIGRLYMTNALETDDLLPPGLLSLSTPDHRESNRDESSKLPAQYEVPSLR